MSRALMFTGETSDAKAMREAFESMREALQAVRQGWERGRVPYEEVRAALALADKVSK